MFFWGGGGGGWWGFKSVFRTPDKEHIFSSQHPMIDHLLESSHRDDLNKWSNIEFVGKKISQVVSIEIYFTLIF